MRIFDLSRARSAHNYLLLDVAARTYAIDGFTSQHESYLYLMNDALGVYVMVHKGQLIACCTLDHDNSRLWLRSLYVDAEFRRNGLGTSMLHTARQRARYFGHDCIYVRPLSEPGERYLVRHGLFCPQSSHVLKAFL